MSHHMIKNVNVKICTIRQMKYFQILRAEQVHCKLPFFFNNSLNELFHKTFLLNLNEFIQRVIKITP